MSKIRIIIYTIFFSVLIFSFIIIINIINVYPNNNEKNILNKHYKYSKILTEQDLIKFQNNVIDEIKHVHMNNQENINIDSIIFHKKGYCYDRSMLMQKYLLMNNYRVRPIYIYRNISNNRVLDFFRYNLNSHNLFEVYFKQKWYVIRTNDKIVKMETLEEYLHSNNTFSKNVFYIRYLFSRNSYFIKPYLLPDIYFF